MPRSDQNYFYVELKLAPAVEYLNPLRFLIKSFRTPLDSKLDVTLFSIISSIFTKLWNGSKPVLYHDTKIILKYFKGRSYPQLH